MKTNLIAVFLCVFSVCTPLYGIQMHYANTTCNGVTFIDKACAGEVVKIESETPETLNILNTDCVLGAPSYSAMTAPGSWEENYIIKKAFLISRRQGISQVRNIGIVTLYKNRDDGVVGVAFSDHSGRKHLFRPADGQRLGVTTMPDIFVNKVQVSNVRADGSLIDDCNSVMAPDNIDCLKVSAAYQINSKDKDAGFLFRVVTKNGDIVRSSEVSEADDNALAPGRADDKHHIQACIQFSKEDLNRIEKGSRLEVYAGGSRLCAVDLPIRGRIVYKPTLVVRERTSENEIHCVPFNPRNNSLYGEPSLTKQPVIASGKHQYRVLEWREIEL